MIRLNDTDWDKAVILAHREQIIQLRDEALKQNDFQWAVTLSLTVGLLYELAKLTEEASLDMAHETIS